MGIAASPGGGAADRVVELEDRRSVAETHGRSTAELAWLVAIPCAGALIVAVLALGPPLSDLLDAIRPRIELLAGDRWKLAPEPLEGARYLIALCGPVLLTVAIVGLARRSGRWRRLHHRGTPLVLGAQILTLAAIVACFVGQHDAVWQLSFFTPRTLAVAAILALVLAFAAPPAWRRLRDSRVDRSRRWQICLALAACVVAVIWLLPAVNSEPSITGSFFYYDTAFPVDETFAVLNGLTPLADFNAQYASLIPYATALSLLVFGKTVLVFTITMCVLSTIALLAAYDVLRRASRSALVAFLLFLPFVATSLFDPYGIALWRFTAGSYFQMLPLRYGGPYVLAWVLARQLERPDRARTWLLFGAAGLVMLDNFEFGLPAFGATVVALLITGMRLRRLGVSIVLGLAGATTAVAALTLLRAGSLPDISRLTQYSGLYGLAGYSAIPMPGVLGLPLIIYLTYAAAIGTSVVRSLDRAANQVLTGMLAWSGVFGLGAGSYYLARSDSSLLPMTFTAWTFALMLLALAVLEATGDRRERRSLLPSLAVFFGVGLALCSLAQLPFPWREIRRVQTRPAEVAFDPDAWSLQPPQTSAARWFVASIREPRGKLAMRAGAPVAIFRASGHRMADAYGVVNVVPVTGVESLHTRREFVDVLDTLRERGGNTLLLQPERVGALASTLERRGFRLLTHSGLRTAPLRSRGAPADAIVMQHLTKWVDTTRHP